MIFFLDYWNNILPSTSTLLSFAYCSSETLDFLSLPGHAQLICVIAIYMFFFLYLECYFLISFCVLLPIHSRPSANILCSQMSFIITLSKMTASLLLLSYSLFFYFTTVTSVYFISHLVMSLLFLLLIINCKIPGSWRFSLYLLVFADW